MDFVLEVDEDLYVAYLLIDPGDLLYGWTVREFRGREGSRGERVRVYVGLRVEALEYHAFRGTLRVRGVIVEVPEWFEGARGSHHTMELMKGLEYRLVKPGGIDREFVDKILEAFSGASASVLLVSVFMEGEGVDKLGITGDETFDIIGLSQGLRPRQVVDLVVHKPDGGEVRTKLLVRLDTPMEVQYFLNGGILQYVLRQIIKRELKK